MLKSEQIRANVVRMSNMPFNGHSIEKRKFVLLWIEYWNMYWWPSMASYCTVFTTKKGIILMIKQVNRKLIVFIFISKHIHACTHLIQNSHISISSVCKQNAWKSDRLCRSVSPNPNPNRNPYGPWNICICITYHYVHVVLSFLLVLFCFWFLWIYFCRLLSIIFNSMGRAVFLGDRIIK